MSTEKFRTNKSSLAKLLEKKEQAPTYKIYENGTKINSVYFNKLKALAEISHKEQDIETIARLEAVGCVIELGVLLHIDSKYEVQTGAASRAWESFKQLQESDKYDNMWRGNLWQASNISMSRPRGYGKMVRDERYTVAGVTYASKTEFLLSRTELGKALL